MKGTELLIILVMAGVFMTGWDTFFTTVAQNTGQNWTAISIADADPSEGAKEFALARKSELETSGIEKGTFNENILVLMPKALNMVLKFFDIPSYFESMMTKMSVGLPVNIDPLTDMGLTIIIIIVLSIVAFAILGKWL